MDQVADRFCCPWVTHLLRSEPLDFLSEPKQVCVVLNDRDDVFQIGTDRLVELDQAGFLVLVQEDLFPVKVLSQPLVFGLGYWIWRINSF